jgi:hypothetical protein
MEVNIWRSTTKNTGVDNLHRVLWDPKSGVSTLRDAYIYIYIYICLYRHQLLLVYHDMLIYIFDVFFTNQSVLHSIHIHFHFAACIGLARFGQALYICDLSMLNLSCPWAFLPISCRWLDVNPPYEFQRSAYIYLTINILIELLRSLSRCMTCKFKDEAAIYAEQ